MRGPKEIVRAGYDQAAQSYLAARPADGGDVALLAELRARVPGGSPVLDAGCGAGMPVTDALGSMGLRTVGLDFSRGQRTLARRRHLGATWVRGDLAALPFADGSFAGVVSDYAIIHVPGDEHATVVREVSRVLRPGGWALLCLGLGDMPHDDDPRKLVGRSHVLEPFRRRRERRAGPRRRASCRMDAGGARPDESGRAPVRAGRARLTKSGHSARCGRLRDRGSYASVVFPDPAGPLTTTGVGRCMSAFCKCRATGRYGEYRSACR